MAVPELSNVVDSGVPAPAPAAPAPRILSRWERFGIPGLMLVLFLVWGGVEGYGIYCRRQTVERLKLWARALPGKARVPLRDVEARLTGQPRRKVFDHQGATRIIYTWPSLIGTYRMRAQVRLGGSVLYLDTESNESEDFMTPFLVANEDGVRAPQYSVPRLAQPVREGRIDMVTETRAAFAQPRLTTLQRPLAIFPAVDQQGAIIPAGAALAATAQFSLAFTDQKRMSLDPRVVRRTLADNRCWSPGMVVDQAQIDLCLKSIGTEAYAVPRIAQRGGIWQVQLEVRHTLNQPPLKLELQATEFNQIPGVIVLGLFDHMQVPLSSEERQIVAQPQFRSVTDAEEFSRVGAEPVRDEDFALNLYSRLLVPNPQWIAAWDYYLDRQSGERPSSRQSLALSSSSVRLPQDLRVQNCLSLARRIASAGPGTSRSAYLDLLKLVPLFRGESHFHQQLVVYASFLRDDALVAELLKIWKAENDSYESHIARAQGLVNWAPHEDTAFGKSVLLPLQIRLRQERLHQARQELEQAVALNPRCWEAHAELIRVADGLRLPWKQIHLHFEQALRLSPDNQRAWEYILSTRTHKYGLSHAEDMYRFADECLDSGLWRLQIPQQVPDLLRGIAYDPETKKVDDRQFAAPEYWRLIEKYYRLSEGQPFDELARRVTQASFAHAAVLSGHYTEAAPVFDQLDRPFQPPPLPANSPPDAVNTVADPVPYRFGGQIEYERLRDLVRDKMRLSQTAVPQAVAE